MGGAFWDGVILTGHPLLLCRVRFSSPGLTSCHYLYRRPPSSRISDSYCLLCFVDLPGTQLWMAVRHAAAPVVKLPTRRRSRCCIYVTSPGRLRSCYRPVGYSLTTHDGATSHMLHPLLTFVTITFPFLPKTVLCVLAIWTLLF